jgi:hypothetical protein
MKKYVLLLGLAVFGGLSAHAQNFVWNMPGADPSRYAEITKEQLLSMFDDNQLGNSKKHKMVIDMERYLTRTSTILSLLALMPTAAAGLEPSSKSIYFSGVPNTITGKVEIYFSQGVKYDTLELGHGSTESVRYSVIPVDGYRVLEGRRAKEEGANR